MLRQSDKELIRKLDLSYPAGAVKLRFEQPDVPHYSGEKLAFCQYVKVVQETGKHFYIGATAEWPWA